MIRLFDAYTATNGRRKGDKREYTRESWLEEMERLSIDRALVRPAATGFDRSVPTFNESLLESCRDFESLTPCAIVIPNTRSDGVPDDERVADLVAHGVGAVSICPKEDYWSLKPWASGPLFEALQERRVPIFCEDPQLSLEDVARLAEAYPNARFIVAGYGYRVLRTLVPLLKAFPKVHVSLGGAFAQQNVLEHLVTEVGADRILFGTGYPVSDPMAAITQLTYADLADEQRQAIGAANIERLVEEIRR